MRWNRKLLCLLGMVLLSQMGNHLIGQSYFASLNALGNTRICRGDSIGARIWFWGGTSPYTVVINDDQGEVLTLENYESLEPFYLKPTVSTTFYLASVVDSKGRKGGAYGSIEATVDQPTPVTIVADRKAFLESEPGVPLKSSPSGATFRGPGVSGTTFYPAVATHVGSPHRITCTYENQNGCLSTDRENFYVLSGNSSVQLLLGGVAIDLVCNDGVSYTLKGNNDDQLSGTFELFRKGSSNPIVGHITDDNLGDNEAIITFKGLSGTFEVVYTYGMESIEIKSYTEVLVYQVDLLGVQELPDTICQNDLAFPLVPLVGAEDPNATYRFSGSGVTGNQVDGYYLDPGHPDLAQGLNQIELDYTASNGCSTQLSVLVYLGWIPTLSFQSEDFCLGPEGDTLLFNNTTSQKEKIGEWTWEFGDPSSGENNFSSLESPEHFYSEPGLKSILMGAISKEGCATQQSFETLVADIPEVDFNWESDCYKEEAPVVFQAAVLSEYSDLDILVWTLRSTDGEVVDVIGKGPTELSLEYAFSSLDSYDVTLYAESLAGCEGEQSRRIKLVPVNVLTEEGYMETFDQGQGDWSVDSEEQLESWILGEPDFTGFEPIENDLAWYTDLPDQAGGYLENSWVLSPCFDFSALSQPVIQMDLMKSFMPGTDGAVLQYRDKESEGWETLGSKGSGLRWYNQSEIYNRPGGSSVGWGLSPFEPDTKWVTARHSLNALAGKSDVKFRIAIASGGSQEITSGKYNQGFAFNNFFLGETVLRRSVLEYFTNSSGESMFAVDAKVNEFAMANAGLVFDLHYHMSYPQEDPMNTNNPLPPSTRAFNYGVPVVPYAVLNGGASPEYRFDLTPQDTKIDEEVLYSSSVESPLFELLLTVDYAADGLEGVATVVCLDDNFNSNLQLYLVVIEKEVTAYGWLNQDSMFRNVVLDMLPTPAGKLLGNNWTPGKTSEIDFSWDYASYVEDVEDLSVVAFVQDRESGSILQAEILPHTFGVSAPGREVETHSMELYPNPARDYCTINFGSNTDKKGQLLVVDISGREVLISPVQQGVLVKKLDLKELPEGLFMVLWKESGIVRGEAKLIRKD